MIKNSSNNNSQRLQGIIIIVLIGFLLQGCSGPNDRIHQQANPGNEIEISIHPYGRTIFALDQNNLLQGLNEIKADYSLFLNGDLTDSLRLKQLQAFISDTFLVDINRKCLEVYPDLNFIEDELGRAFTRFSYFFPEEKIPMVYTYVSGFDYEHRIQYYNDNLIIALDMYLGPGYENYKKLGLPVYVLSKFDKSYLIRDSFYSIAQGQIYQNKIGDNLLDALINEGKLLWFVNLMLPDLEPEILFDYSSDQLAWVKSQETMVWAFLLENEMLYSSNSEFRMKWLNDAPFTSYFGPDAPSHLGGWIGYEIVDAYMSKNEDVSPTQLMQQYDAQRILKESHFKPKQ